MGSIISRLADSFNSLSIWGDPDPTLQLPDEILCQVFSNLQSLPDRFRSAAVNRKFRRCMLTELSKPIPLLVSCFPSFKRMNGHKVTNDDKFLDGVKILAQVAQFSSIRVGKWPKSTSDVLHNTFDILCQTECLREVKIFELSEKSCPLPVFRKALTACAKVSSVKIGLRVAAADFVPHLTAALNHKSLTELVLTLGHLHETQMMSHIFEAVQPNTLKDVELSLLGIGPHTVLAVVNQLGGSAAWAALGDLHLRFHWNAEDHEMQSMDAFLAGLTVFHFNTHYHFQLGLRPFNQFGASVVSVLSKALSPGTSLRCEIVADNSSVSACGLIDFVTLVQAAHPNVQVGLGNEWFCWLEFSLNNISLAVQIYTTHCPDEACVRCLSFYQNVIYSLASQIGEEESGYLENYRLDGCRVERVVDDLNELARLRGREWQAIDAQANHDQTEATITLEDKNGEEFFITVALDRCFNNTCPRCLMIE